MRSLAKTSFLGVSTVLFVFCLATPARAQYCEQDCAPGYGGLGYPMCDQRCNAGGGDYSQTCGSMGYACCNSYVAVAQVLGEHSHRVFPFICSVDAWVNLQNVVQCPDQTYYGGTWCAQVGSGFAFTSEPFSDCCDTGGCWGQTWC
jgi:hypothetical protein